jgi:prepilin-type N-terminal cleavage/methylation domain-containing protein
MKKFFHKKRKIADKGFTIIEMIIAIAIFLIVITMGVSALMNLYSVNRKAQNTRNILDGLSFAMEDMSRNIRTGYNYKCIISSVSITSELVGPGDCATGGFGIGFEYSDGSTTTSDDQWFYYIEGGKLFRSTGGLTLADRVQMTPDEVIIDATKSGFEVFGSEGVDLGDTQQPIVRMRLVGEIVNARDGNTSFSLQTTVSQRLSDI